jgi:hypothetical protein
MKNSYLLPLSLIFLAGSIIVSSWMISNAINPNFSFNNTKDSSPTRKALMTINEAANYLGIPSAQFTSLIETQNNQKQNLQSYNTYRFIPYLNIGSDKFFSEAEINKWVEYNMLNK